MFKIMYRILIAASIFSAATSAQTCGEAITATTLVCGTNEGAATGQTVSFDPRS